ncbi:MAG: substrate-binding domain-containing protein [Opitutales bacterium]
MKAPIPSLSFPALLRIGAAAVALLLAGCGGSSSTPAAASSNSTAAAPAKTLHLAFIPKGMQNVYWKSVQAGMLQAQKEAEAKGTKVDIDWNGPPNEGDRAAQIALMETYVAQGLDGIILCPMEYNALVAPAEKAHRAGIPLVIVDSPLNYPETVAFVGTGNRKAGVMAGDELARELGEKGNVIMMRFMPGSASTNEREEGFLDAMKKYPNITILSSDNYAGDDREKALDKGSNLLSRYQNVDGIFTPNEPSTNGMLLAIEKAGLAGKVKFVGFDGGAANMAGLQAGEINALVLQDPYTMGYDGVNTMLDFLAGKTVPTNIDTGTVLLTKDNQDTPAVKALLAHTVM